MPSRNALETFAVAAVGSFASLYILEHINILHHTDPPPGALPVKVPTDPSSTFAELAAMSNCKGKCAPGDPCLGGKCVDVGCQNPAAFFVKNGKRECSCPMTNCSRTFKIPAKSRPQDVKAQGPTPIGPTTSPIQDIVGGFQNALGNLFGTNPPTAVGTSPAPAPITPEPIVG